MKKRAKFLGFSNHDCDAFYECPDCKHFVGCEAACGGRVCDSFEAKAPPVSGFAEDALRDFSHFLIDAATKQPLCAGDIPDLLKTFKEERCNGKI